MISALTVGRSVLNSKIHASLSCLNQKLALSEPLGSLTLGALLGWYHTATSFTFFQSTNMISDSSMPTCVTAFWNTSRSSGVISGFLAAMEEGSRGVLDKGPADGRPGRDVGCGWVMKSKEGPVQLGTRDERTVLLKDSPPFFTSFRSKASMKIPCFFSTIRWAKVSTPPPVGRSDCESLE